MAKIFKILNDFDVKIVNIVVRRNLKLDGARMFEDYILIQCDQMREIE
ncbi:hypothetical protein [Streptococcus sp. oral taxon 056]|nr:hypothetical protein [Streptococcus sp. oral taxon 056]